MATFIEEEYGGAGLGFLEHSLITEEFWRVDPGCGQAFVRLELRLGDDPGLRDGRAEAEIPYAHSEAGKAIIGFAITEPDAGSDVTMVRTRAETKG